MSSERYDGRCKVVREFADGSVSRCAQVVINPKSDDTCYYCKKIEGGLTKPYYSSPELDIRVVKAYHKDTGKVIYSEYR